MTWANVDDLFPEHPKVLAAGGDAGWLYICGLCFTNRNLTEGHIPKAVVPRISDRKAPMKLAQRLVDVGLWHDKGDYYVIHDWDKYNENADEVKARKEHARTAARARWAGKPKPPSSSAQPMPGAMPGASAEHPSGTCSPPNGAMPSHSSPTPYSNSSVLKRDGAGVPPGKIEEEIKNSQPPTQIEHHKLQPLAEHMAEALWPGRPRMLAESVVVVGRCLAVADPALVDECIGSMLAADDRPHTPRYLLATVRNRLIGMGAYAPGDAALEPLGASA
jgi:hypothetical protein